MRVIERAHGVDLKFALFIRDIAHELPNRTLKFDSSDRVVAIMKPSFTETIVFLPRILAGTTPTTTMITRRGRYDYVIANTQELYSTDINPDIATPDKYYPEESDNFDIDDVKSDLYDIQKGVDPEGTKPRIAQQQSSLYLGHFEDDPGFTFDSNTMRKIISAAHSALIASGRIKEAENARRFLEYLDNFYTIEPSAARAIEDGAGPTKNRLGILGRAIRDSRPLFRGGQYIDLQYREGHTTFYFDIESGELRSVVPNTHRGSRDMGRGFGFGVTDSKAPAVILYQFSDYVFQKMMKDTTYDKILGKLRK